MVTYRNPRLSATVHDWPSGTKRVTATFTVEQDPKRGERAVRITTGAPKKLTFARKMRIVDGDDGRTYLAVLSNYGFVVIMQGGMQFQQEVIHACAQPERHAQVMALFEAQQ